MMLTKLRTKRDTLFDSLKKNSDFAEKESAAEEAMRGELDLLALLLREDGTADSDWWEFLKACAAIKYEEMHQYWEATRNAT